jgi:transcriptional regulator with XRE-family HTH domain
MANPLVKTVAATVRQFRKAKNMSQDDLAHVSGLDRTYISGVERGVRNITLESLEQIIKALEIPNSVFFKAVIEEDCSDLHVKQER